MALYVSNADITRTTVGQHGWNLASNDTLLVGADAMIAAQASASNGVLGATGVTVILQGDIIATQHGIALGGAGEVRVGQDGSVAGMQDGVRMEGPGGELVNAGDIIGGTYGVNFIDGSFSFPSTVNNTGMISGATALRVAGDLSLVNTGHILGSGDTTPSGGTLGDGVQVTGGATIVNHGVIASTFGDGISAGATGDAVSIHNTGSIAGSASAYAIVLDAGNDSVVNAGTITGRVALHNGHDLYDGTRGSISGRVEGDDGHDTLLGGNGAETLDGGQGDDVVEGGAGADSLQGNGGNDTVDAGEGNDTVEGGHGLDVMEGGAGFDILSYASSFGAVEANLGTGEANGGTGEGDVFSGFEGVVGTLFADTLTGSAAADQLAGGLDNDQLTGGAGADRLLGQAGGDVLFGGAGADVMRGGADADTFRYTAIADSTVAGKGRDRLLDFSQVEGDRINLQAIDANSGAVGNQDFAFIFANAFSGTAGELRAVAGPMATMVYGDVNGDSLADFAIQLSGSLNMTAADFIL